MIKERPRFDTSNLVPVIKTLIAHQVEGIVFAASKVNSNISTARSQLPAYCLLEESTDPKYTTIGIDNYSGARAAVEYLPLGRHKISGPLEWLEARQRRQAWEDALTSGGWPVSNHQWSSGDWSSASGEAAFAELMQKFSEMDAVFDSNNHGLRVPEDLAVADFDDIAEAAYFSPALTTVRQPLRELGVLAVQTLLSWIGSAAMPILGNNGHSTSRTRHLREHAHDEMSPFSTLPIR